MFQDKLILVLIALNINQINTNNLADDDSNRKLKLILEDNEINIEREDTKIKINVNKDIIESQKDEQTDEYLENNNQTYKEDINDTEPCVGAKRYCNMTEADYVTMMKNYIYPKPFEWVLISIHSLVFVLGLVGNALVCVAVYINRNRDMQSITNIFIVNLAVADFMVILFCLPATVAWDVTKTWWLGEVLCKFLVYFQSVAVTVSVLTLTVISVDRWYKFCFPLRSRCTKGRARARARASILIIWLISLCFNAPELVVLTVVVEIPLRFNLQYLLQCAAVWSDDPEDRSDFIWHIVKILFNYTIPLLLMTVAYYQIVRELWNNSVPGNHEQTRLIMARRKASKMLVAVVIMFAVCYFPVHLLAMLRYSNVKQSDLLTILGLVSHLLCYANSAINPLIYNIMSETFRKAFWRAIGCQWSASPVHESFTTLTRVTSRFNSQNRSCKRQDHYSTIEPHVHYKSSSYLDSSCKSVL